MLGCTTADVAKYKNASNGPIVKIALPLNSNALQFDSAFFANHAALRAVESALLCELYPFVKAKEDAVLLDVDLLSEDEVLVLYLFVNTSVPDTIHTRLNDELNSATDLKGSNIVNYFSKDRITEDATHYCGEETKSYQEAKCDTPSSVPVRQLNRDLQYMIYGVVTFVIMLIAFLGYMLGTRIKENRALKEDILKLQQAGQAAWRTSSQLSSIQLSPSSATNVTIAVDKASSPEEKTNSEGPEEDSDEDGDWGKKTQQQAANGEHLNIASGGGKVATTKKQSLNVLRSLSTLPPPSQAKDETQQQADKSSCALPSGADIRKFFITGSLICLVYEFLGLAMYTVEVNAGYGTQVVMTILCLGYSVVMYTHSRSLEGAAAKSAILSLVCATLCATLVVAYTGPLFNDFITTGVPVETQYWVIVFLSPVFWPIMLFIVILAFTMITAD